MSAEKDQVLLKISIELMQFAECLSPTECHDAAYGLLGRVDTDALLEHTRGCAPCQARLAQAEHEAQQTIRNALVALDQPAVPGVLPANIMQLLSVGSELPDRRPADVWEEWQALVGHWIRPQPAPAVEFDMAARGVAAHFSQSPLGRAAVEIDCAAVTTRVQTFLARGAGVDIWAELLDRSGRPISGRELRLLTEGAAAPETQRTSLRGMAVFRARSAGHHILHVDEGDFVGIELGNHTCAF